MKKWILPVCLLFSVCAVYGQDMLEAPAPAECSLPPEAAAAPAKPAAQAERRPAAGPEELKKRFKARGKEIRKLAKQYRKASASEKPQIKARLSRIVSEATDEGLTWSKERIAAERANLDRWEQKLREQEKDLPAVKAKRVDDILSGEAERRYKLAQKRWKREMKDHKRAMK